MIYVTESQTGIERFSDVMCLWPFFARFYVLNAPWFIANNMLYIPPIILSIQSITLKKVADYENKRQKIVWISIA